MPRIKCAYDAIAVDRINSISSKKVINIFFPVTYSVCLYFICTLLQPVHPPAFDDPRRVLRAVLCRVSSCLLLFGNCTPARKSFHCHPSSMFILLGGKGAPVPTYISFYSPRKVAYSRSLYILYAVQPALVALAARLCRVSYFRCCCPHVCCFLVYILLSVSYEAQVREAV